MSHSLEESQQMIQAVRKTKQIVQVGMQRRSAPSVIKAKQTGRQRHSGQDHAWPSPCGTGTSPRRSTTRRCPANWIGSASSGPRPDRDLEPMRFRSWRYFWDYSGGNMTDQGTHLMDVVQWFTNSGPAQSAVCFGQSGQEHRLGSARCVLRGLRIPEPDGHLDAELLQLLRERLVHPVPGRPGHHDPQQRRLPDLERARGPRIPTPVQTDGGAHPDRDAHSEFSGLREVAASSPTRRWKWAPARYRPRIWRTWRSMATGARISARTAPR